MCIKYTMVCCFTQIYVKINHFYCRTTLQKQDAGSYLQFTTSKLTNQPNLTAVTQVKCEDIL